MLFGEKVTIGPLMNEDALPLFCWFNDPAAARDDYSYRPVDQATHAAWWENVGRDTSKVVFAIRRIGETRMLGYVHLINIDTVHRAAEMGIRIGAEADRNLGFGRDAIGLILRYGFDSLNLDRISLQVLRDNTRAIHTYEAAGFRREGILRHARFIQGEWRDLVIMAVLRRAPRRRSRPPAAALSQATASPP